MNKTIETIFTSPAVAIALIALIFVMAALPQEQKVEAQTIEMDGCGHPGWANGETPLC